MSAGASLCIAMSAGGCGEAEESEQKAMLGRELLHCVFQSRHDRTVEKLEELKDKLTGLLKSGKIEELKGELASSTKKIEELEVKFEKIEEFEGELGSSTLKLEKIEELEGELKSWKASLDSLTKQIEVWVGQLAFEAAANAAKENRANEAEVELTSLISDVDEGFDHQCGLLASIVDADECLGTSSVSHEESTVLCSTPSILPVDADECLDTSSVSHEGSRISPIAVKALVDERICGICLEELYGKAMVITACGHGFHWSCLSRVRGSLCPQCRLPVDNDPVFPEPQERRYSDDGTAYTYDEFVAHFGTVDGPSRWARSPAQTDEHDAQENVVELVEIVVMDVVHMMPQALPMGVMGPFGFMGPAPTIAPMRPMDPLGSVTHGAMHAMAYGLNGLVASGHNGLFRGPRAPPSWPGGHNLGRPQQQSTAAMARHPVMRTNYSAHADNRTAMARNPVMRANYYAHADNRP